MKSSTMLRRLTGSLAFMMVLGLDLFSVQIAVEAAGPADRPAAESQADENGNREKHPAQTAGEEEAPSGEREVSEAEIDAFFQNSVFVGDSVMLGFRNYAMARQDTFLANMNFLAAGSFSVNNSLWPVNSESVHPIYQGQKRQIWESISMMGADKVFLFFGLNDLNISGVEGTCEKYAELIGRIKESSPDAQIHIMSMTYTLRGKGKGQLNNDVIRQLNDRLRQIAAENGWGFVDLATPLSDENGDLAPQYCSDFFVHQTPAAYDMWTAVLRDYAGQILKNTPAPAGGTAQAAEPSAESSIPVAPQK